MDAKAPALKSTAATGTRIINKNLSKAKQLITNFKTSTGASGFKPAFINIKSQAGPIASGLLKRINQPWLIRQGDSSLCGPAAFMYCLAKDSPQLYVQCIIDLYIKGEAIINKLKIKPSNACLQSKLHSSMDAVDWVALASLRDSSNDMFTYTSVSDEASGITLPSMIESWFKQAGYTNVENKTNLFFDKSVDSLYKANQAFKANKNVCLFVSAKAIDLPFAISLIPNHWVVLSSELKSGPKLTAPTDIKKLEEEVISLPVFTWGLEKFEMNQKKLTAEDFADYFFGYVSAS